MVVSIHMTVNSVSNQPLCIIPHNVTHKKWYVGIFKHPSDVDHHPNIKSLCSDFCDPHVENDLSLGAIFLRSIL